MAAISFATPTAPATDAASSRISSDKGRAFVSTFTDAEHKAAKPVESKSQRSDSKDKDDRDDKQDDKGQATASTATPAAQPAATAANARDDKTSDGKKAGDKGAAPRAVAASTGSADSQPGETDPTAVDTSETPVDAAQLAPVLDALKQVASIAQQATTDAPAPQAQPEAPAVQTETAAAAEPLPATASLLAARIVPANAQQSEAKPAMPSKKSPRAEAAADKTAAIDATATPSAATTDPQAQATPDSTTVAQPSAGQQLAAGGTDRALEVAKQGAWLDGLARDIAAIGSTSSTLKFQAAPTHLGAVQVEIARGLEGAAVTLTASSEGARTALADARPQLIAEARAQGIHIASAQVDVSADSRQSNSGSQPDQRHDPRGGTSFSSQTGGEGGQNRQSQTRSQPFAINPTSESQPVATAEAEDSATTSAAPTGGMYA